MQRRQPSLSPCVVFSGLQQWGHRAPESVMLPTVNCYAHGQLNQGPTQQWISFLCPYWSVLDAELLVQNLLRANVLLKRPLPRRRGAISATTVGHWRPRRAAGAVGAGVCTVRLRVCRRRVEKRGETGLIVAGRRASIRSPVARAVGRLGVRTPRRRYRQRPRWGCRQRGGRVSLLTVAVVDRG